MNFDLKKFLKNLKLNEDNISMVLGAVVIVIVGILIVNYFKDKGKGTTLTGENTETQNGRDHVVTEGETLWSISEDSYGTGYKWTDIKEANKLTSDKIETGQTLKIPEITTAATPAPKGEIAPIATPASQPTQGDAYTVVAGDSLWKIATEEYGDGGRWVDIAKANNLKNPDLIHPGNVFTLPR